MPKKKKSSGVAAIFVTSFEFETKGRKADVEKIAKGLAKQMDRQYVCHKSKRLKTKVKGRLVTTIKGIRLTKEQKLAAIVANCK